jgi:hypothetical protein
MKPTQIAISLALAGLSLAPVAVETGFMVKTTELKAKPFLDAAKVVEVSEKTSVEIISRQSAWMQVKTREGKSGWVKMLSVRTGSGSASTGAEVSGVLATASLFTTGSSGATETTGVKGLSKEQIRNAQPNPAELAKLNSFSASADDASKFAKAAKLSSNSIDYLATTKP